MNDQDFKKIFTAHKTDVPDNGFSEHVVRQLPERKNRLSQIIMAVFTLIGLILFFVIQGITPLLEQINHLIVSISHLQAPSPSSVITYISLLATIGIVGYSVMQVDAG